MSPIENNNSCVLNRVRKFVGNFFQLYLRDAVCNILQEKQVPRKHNYLSEKVEMRESEVAGKGIFAKEKVEAGDLVAIFGGNVMSLEEWESIEDETAKYVCMMIHPGFMVGPSSNKELDDGDYVNHSCQPNIGIKGQICAYALRDIEPDEEITFDYGTIVGGFPDSLWEMECKCGKSNCRKIIRPSDWNKLKNSPELHGFFAPHIQELIDKE